MYGDEEKTSYGKLQCHVKMKINYDAMLKTSQ